MFDDKIRNHDSVHPLEVYFGSLHMISKRVDFLCSFIHPLYVLQHIRKSIETKNETESEEAELNDADELSLNKMN